MTLQTIAFLSTLYLVLTTAGGTTNLKPMSRKLINPFKMFFFYLKEDIVSQVLSVARLSLTGGSYGTASLISSSYFHRHTDALFYFGSHVSIV